MEVRQIINFSREIPLEAFYHSIGIYLTKPQVLNRKLNSSKNLLTVKIKAKNEIVLEIFRKHCSELQDSIPYNLDNMLRDSTFEYKNVKLEDIINHINENQDGVIAIFDKIITRNVKKHNSCFQLAILDPNIHSIAFYGLSDTSKILPAVSYEIQYENNQLKLFVDSNDSEINTNRLEFVLLKKFKNWMESFEEDCGRDFIESHSLINSEEYSALYAELKDKYGRKFEEIWTEEVTDPKKYIYEDIAIATYLLTFWKRQRIEENLDRKQSFIDFGCGNGLLVAILSMEGHKGYGIDIRKRKIWDKYDASVDLREITWTPSDTLESCDWIIGNHSDELSPWVPVVAARNSFKCNYFLLPCCAFEFSGAKFQRKGPSKSLYLSFIDYLKEISLVCGYKSTLVDRLKIPSTKRICLIGMGREYDEDKTFEYNEKIENFINVSKSSFVPREKEQAVRNCTKIDKNLTDRIVRTIFDALLSEENFCENHWNIGKEINLSDSVKLISSDDLKKLKSENGGLQTLLRNKHQIFEVHSGKLKIRKPQKITERTFSKKVALKTSPCYFHLHHKQGCFLKEDECCYRHE